MAIELDLSKLLCSSFTNEGIHQKIEYENLPSIYFHCGITGHLESTCLARNLQNVEKVPPAREITRNSESPVDNQVPAESPQPDPDLGPWMTQNDHKEDNTYKEYYWCKR